MEEKVKMIEDIAANTNDNFRFRFRLSSVWMRRKGPFTRNFYASPRIAVNVDACFKV